LKQAATCCRRLRTRGVAAGSIVEVSDLYFNTPARRQFAAQPANGYAHSEETFKRLALSRPHVRFVLTHNGRAQWHLQPCGAEERTLAVLGDEFAAASLPVRVEARASACTAS
jgi:DNA mismatch repair protein MutL